jgi:hypothetical protein
MTDKEKIDLLINAQTKENNYLAMRLMLDVLGYSFEKSFLNLKPYKASLKLLHLEIAAIKIEYDVYFGYAIVTPSEWCDIKRTVYYKEKSLPNMFCQYYLEEDYVRSIADLDAIEDLEDIHNDLKKISPQIESLFLAL